MRILYNISIYIIYFFIAPIISLFSYKIRLWNEAHKKSSLIINKIPKNKSSSMWFIIKLDFLCK